MTFGETLTNLRKSKGLSQSQLADALNLTRQTISKWELDQSTPDITYILHLASLQADTKTKQWTDERFESMEYF